MLIPFETLQKKYRVNPKGVLHVGANVGEEAEAYEKAGVKRVIWIEANTKLLPRLIVNTIDKYGLHHRVINVCVSDKDDEHVVFHLSNNDGQSSSFLELGTHAKNHPTVKFVEDVPMITKRIDTILKDHDWNKEPIDYLSMDIQGAELLALKGMGELLRQFKWLYLEVNQEEVYKGNGLVGEVDRYVKGFGFYPLTQVYTRARWGDKLYVKR